MSPDPRPLGEGVVHIAAYPIEIGGQLRQRCGWCGAVLIDVDLANVGAMVADPADPDQEYPVWEPGGLVGVDGGVCWSVAHVDGAPLPAEACAQLPHDITGATP